jgi:hypothetical protein
MKHIILLFTLMFSLSHISYGDNDHKVLSPDLNQKYEGKSKKGLAHGKGKAWGEKDYYEGSFKKGLPHGYGIYKWGNGTIYKGNFVKGKMDGEGELLIILPSGKQEIQKGYFKKNEYLGKYKNPYKVISQQGIQKVVFRENRLGDINEVKIKVYSNGQLLSSSLTISDLDNTITENMGEGVTLTNVQFPLKRVEVSFNSGRFSHMLVFEIYKKGNWEVIISV